MYSERVHFWCSLSPTGGLVQPFAAQTFARATSAAGWIRVLRESLGLTAAAFARRLKIAPQNVVKLENSERAGTITLAVAQRLVECGGKWEQCRVVGVDESVAVAVEVCVFVTVCVDV